MIFIGQLINKYWKIIASVLILSLAAYGVSLIFLRTSSAYSVASSFVFSSNDVKEAIGVVNAVNFTVHANLSFSGGRGKGHYYLDVLTDSGTKKVYVELVKLDGNWEVINHRIVR